MFKKIGCIVLTIALMASKGTFLYSMQLKELPDNQKDKPELPIEIPGINFATFIACNLAPLLADKASAEFKALLVHESKEQLEQTARQRPAVSVGNEVIEERVSAKRKKAQSVFKVAKKSTSQAHERFKKDNSLENKTDLISRVGDLRAANAELLKAELCRWLNQETTLARMQQELLETSTPDKQDPSTSENK